MDNVIRCPICHDDKQTIAERPSHSNPPYDVEFQCYCITCNVNFTVQAKITDLSYSDIENAENGYPYSA